MRLKSGSLYWPTTASPPRARATLRCGLETDVLVIGSGISGALAAHFLTQAGLRVVVVDRRPLLSGSTPASTALVLYEIDTPLTKLARRLGPSRANAAYRATHEALADMESLIKSLARPCELRTRSSLFLARKDRDLGWLEREAAARRAVGIDASLMERRELEGRFGIRRPGAILSTRALEVNPMKLCRALLLGARSRGARLIANAEVDTSRLDPRHAPVTIGACGHSVRAEWVVIATGYEAPEQFAHVARLTQLRSTYAVATNVLARQAWPEHALLWEVGDPYLYARRTADGRVLVGGEDIASADPHTRDRRISATSRTLLRKLQGRDGLYPGLGAKAEYRWAGTFAQTSDGLPYIGRHPRWDRALFALGYGGNGFTYSLIAGQLIRDIILGRRSRLESLFGFGRSKRA